MESQPPRAVLLDIEGTTTPVAFVYETLFPFARRHVREFVEQHYDAQEVRADVEALKEEHRAEALKEIVPAVWHEDSVNALLESVVGYVHWLMDHDRKSTALKSLQGKIWEGGYRSGRLRGQVYADVPPAFDRWKKQGKGIFIFSSGSVLAQKLIFAHTTEGDLTPYLDGYFDTTTGAKTSADSYQSISEKIGAPATAILFVSDVTAELDAARAAGMTTALCVRPGSREPEQSTHPIIRTFDEVLL
ncbi:MAG TPA: acireductone synthase [Pyrinomonadaceae bacterium]|nr:acireductone synthase [Pyrinomonadaceae bacterium]